MITLQEQGLSDLARAASATGKIIEAHSDNEDRICRVVVQMGDQLRNMQLCEAILQLWMQDGFIVSTSRDKGYLMIDGLRDGKMDPSQGDLIQLVAEQLTRYTKQTLSRAAHQSEIDIAPAILAERAGRSHAGLPH